MEKHDKTALTYEEALSEAAAVLKRAGKPNERMDAEVLLASILECKRDRFYREPDRALSAEGLRRFREMVRRRAAGEPLQYLTGVQEFWSIPVLVNPHVLIPRPETEFLVQAALDRLSPEGSPRVLDLGTGSGNVAVALAAERGNVRLTASDISAAALRVALANARYAGVSGRVRFVCGDLFAPFRPARPGWDLIAANPPYVSAVEMPDLDEEVFVHEPRRALVAGPSGLEVVERIVGQAGAHLHRGGWLLIEIGAGQWADVEEMAERAGCWGEVHWVRDLSGIRRVACLPFAAVSGGRI